MSRKKDPQRVEVKWIDPWSNGGWQDPEQALRDVAEHDDTCWTLGYLVEETPAYVAVAGSRTAAKDPQVGDVFKIPRRCIDDIVYLEAA